MNFHLLYIDPGSGSFLVQAIIAAVLSSLFFFKNAWLRVKFFFTGKSKKEKDDSKEKLDAEL